MMTTENHAEFLFQLSFYCKFHSAPHELSTTICFWVSLLRQFILFVQEEPLPLSLLVLRILLCVHGPLLTNHYCMRTVT